MASLRDVMAYICAKYPHKSELSNARLTKMIFLADWRAALEQGRQITGIRWQFNHYGPFVHDVLNLARSDVTFEVTRSDNVYGAPKEVIGLRGETRSFPTLQKHEIKVLDDVMDITAPKYWDDFIRLVYSTYPILTQPRYSELDLSVLAKEYKANIVYQDEPEDVAL